MKTSTKLIISYCFLVVAGILTLYISSTALKDRKQFSERKDSRQYDEMLPAFSVVIVQDSTNCQLTLGDQYSLQWSQFVNSSKNQSFATVKDDTLFVNQQHTIDNADIRITAKQVTLVIVANGATVRLFEPIQDELSVTLENGSCYLEPTINKEKAELLRKTLHLNIQASNKSYIELNSWFDSLKATIDSSMLQVNSCSFIRSVDVELNHNSSSTFQITPAQFNVQRDSTSTIQFY